MHAGRGRIIQGCPWRITATVHPLPTIHIPPLHKTQLVPFPPGPPVSSTWHQLESRILSSKSGMDIDGIFSVVFLWMWLLSMVLLALKNYKLEKLLA